MKRGAKMGTDCHTSVWCGGTIQVQIITPEKFNGKIRYLQVGEGKFGGLARN
jgi:hypothetical protein